MKLGKKTQERLYLAFCYTIILIGVIAVLYPTVWIVGSALNPNNSLFSSRIIPEGASLDNFRELLTHDEYPYLRWYWNTLKIASLNAIFSVVLTAGCAYAFSKFKFWGRKYGMITFLVIQMFPALMALVAIYVVLNMLGLLNTHTGLLLVYVGGAVPFSTWLLKGYFDTIPNSLSESALIDGASSFRIFWSIMLPLAKPMLAVVAMFQFVNPFNDFILANIILTSPSQRTLAVGLFNMVSNQFANDWTLFSAGAVLAGIPMMILFLSLQKYFVHGLSGAVKG
ncbi:sugar ABC transporter permease [Halonatronum saccharophilum]|uniref:sugar ABC transporter permease n=1 Tax=Halonatronum saccharophilum TaxID=150060 RepID=UPI0004B05B5F|nr:sugar ABC transporter permease [Halonatronum saccharophilum]